MTDFEEKFRAMCRESERKRDEQKCIGRMSYLKTWSREFVLQNHQYVFCEVLEVFCKEPDEAFRFKVRTPGGRIAYMECALGHFMERSRSINGDFDGEAFMNGEDSFW